jgi:shikimate kinase
MKHKNKKIIAIVGLMGVGKTTVGGKLAEKLKYYFIDCDSEIEDRNHKTVAEIFAQDGEKYFRESEEKVIEEIVNREENIILSLGGGAFVSKKTQEILKDKAIVIWLEASVDEILHRIGKKNNRPLLNNKNKREILENMVIKRYPDYEKADLKFSTNNINSENLLKKIIQEINQIQNAK